VVYVTLQAKLDVVMNKGDAVQLVCRQHAALRVQDVCGLSVMPKHQNDRKTYRTICDSYSKITAAKTIIFLAVFRLAAFFSAVFRPKPYIFG